MTSTIPALAIRKRLGRDNWATPATFGPDGWAIMHHTFTGKVIITSSPAPDDEDGTGGDWWHASISWADHIPSYDDLALLHKAVWPNGYAYQVFAAPSEHVNIHPFALHLWGRPNGSMQLPNFGLYGSI